MRQRRSWLHHILAIEASESAAVHDKRLIQAFTSSNASSQSLIGEHVENFSVPTSPSALHDYICKYNQLRWLLQLSTPGWRRNYIRRRANVTQREHRHCTRHINHRILERHTHSGFCPLCWYLLDNLCDWYDLNCQRSISWASILHEHRSRARYCGLARWLLLRCIILTWIQFETSLRFLTMKNLYRRTYSLISIPNTDNYFRWCHNWSWSVLHAVRSFHAQLW